MVLVSTQFAWLRHFLGWILASECRRHRRIHRNFDELLLRGLDFLAHQMKDGLRLIVKDGFGGVVSDVSVLVDIGASCLGP